MLTPSTAHLWVPCSLAGNLLASGRYHGAGRPAPKSDSRREGICAARAAEVATIQGITDARELIGHEHPNGWRVDQEMAHHVMGYLEYCRQWGDVIAAEVPVELYGGLIRGRLDTTTVSSQSVVRVFDLKYGWRLVEAYQNWPMLCYGLGEVLKLGRPVDLELHIYQPRPHHPDGPARVWRIAAHEVDGWLKWLYAVATEARDNPRASVGPHCDHCPAQVGCVANAQTSYALYAAHGERRQHDHSAEELAAELRFLEMAAELLADRRKAVTAEAEARIKAGKVVPGYFLKPRAGHRAWITTPDITELATGSSPWKQVLKSPAEMEKEGVPKHVLDVISKPPSLPPKLGNNPQEYADKMFGKAK